MRGFFGDPGGSAETGHDASRYAHDWDQLLTLPRRLTLRDSHELRVEPAGDIESLWYDHRHVSRMILPANQEVVLEDIQGNALELGIEVDPKRASMFEVNVLRSPHKEEFTRICFFHKRGYKYREPFTDDVRAHRIMSSALSHPVRYESMITLDSSCASALPDVLARPPESAPVFIESGETVQLRVFVDRNVVEVFVNGRQCVAIRVYPGRRDSTGVSLLSRGQAAEVLALDCWQMQNIYA